MKKHNLIDTLHENLSISDTAKSLFKKICETPIQKRKELQRDIHRLIKLAGLNYALLALHRQQVNSGFVLLDPLDEMEIEKKEFFDSRTNVKFQLQWNPSRELRKNHDLLIARGVIAKNIDRSKLINNGCYLCKANIDIQNPNEILLGIKFGGEIFYAGANFAPITNNHFTVMSAEHRPARYKKHILNVMNAFVDKTNGYFRAIFNGLAGASIEWHEHIQVTTYEFPIEEIKIRKSDTIYESNCVKVSIPKYYLPVWVVEGKNKKSTERMADEIIAGWHNLDKEFHTENIISTKRGAIYRTFIILRDKRKLTSAGKKGAMGAFETGGLIVFSYEPKIDSRVEINERNTYNRSTLETIKRMLEEISPEKQSVISLRSAINFVDRNI